MDVHLSPCGEAALRLLVEDDDTEHRWRTVHRVADWILGNPIPGVYGSVPTYDSLLVEFDPFRQTYDSLAPLLRLMLRDALDSDQVQTRPRLRFVLPVVYGGEYGPDLGFVADYLGIDEDEAIALHTAEDRVVRCLGGPAASCMTDGPPFSKEIPRLQDPRLEVPPNAVSIAGSQGVIGPVKAPSGWRLIGLSPVDIMDMSSPALVPYRPGDVVRFRSIDPREWGDYTGTHLSDLATQ